MVSWESVEIAVQVVKTFSVYYRCTTFIGQFCFSIFPAHRSKMLLILLKHIVCFQNETGIVVEDRVALACLYLPDEKLMNFIEKLSVELCKVGDLDGLLVTGNMLSLHNKNCSFFVFTIQNARGLFEGLFIQ